MADMELTPLMRQYREIKQGYADAILLFRVGIFTRCSTRMPLKLPVSSPLR